LGDKQMSPNIQPLSILCYREDNREVAHCLEMDLVAAASTREEAVRDLADIVRAHVRYAVEHDNLAHLFKPAPEAYWARLASATLFGKLKIDLSGDLPDRPVPARQFELRELAASA